MSALTQTDEATPAAHAPLTVWHKCGLVAFALIIVAFACLVERRSALRPPGERRMTDAGVYFRAGWAVRSGADLYHVTDDNDWHYNYPPLLAILMTPLADAPDGESRDGLLPYPLSVAIWFALNLLFAVVAVYWLAQALEELSPDAEVRSTPWGCRAWWLRRMAPLLICLAPIAHTLSRGQVNLILLLLVAGMLRAIVRGHNGQAGWWLAGAVCLKIIPAFLLIYPLWRRDWRLLGGCTGGLVIGLALIPCVVFGPQRTMQYYQDLDRFVLRPGLTHAGDDSRAKELTNMTGTGSQSFLVVWHNTLHPDRLTRPDHAASWLRMTAYGMAGIVTLITLWAARRRIQQRGALDAAETYLAWGALILAMLFASPISHMHYQCLCLPLVMGLLVLHPPRGWKRLGWCGLAGLFIAAHILPHLPEITELRDFGLAMYAALLMWAVAVAV
ncbi:MAG TPA: glycosyltransferase family 87 protein, partial [Gemmataceae bacterium]|nr:glycosyltransferase family 87 protein [Gemmataceae bacterium]